MNMKLKLYVKNITKIIYSLIQSDTSIMSHPTGHILGLFFFYLNLFYLIICLLVRMDDDYAGILAPDSRLPFPDSVTLSPSPFSTPTLYKNT